MTTYRLGPVDELPVGEGRAYAVGDEMVAVFRLRTGELRAVSAVCPHAGGPLADGLIDAKVVICPLHQHVFALETGHCQTTPHLALRTYPVREESGQMIMNVSPVSGSDSTTTS
ncbi:nitrite reductase small subunit NirD [Phytohabitans rumicis]|uniref:(2Fe-2S)-binding protein n=1 Tax=Phytohabitans rumicis TaxID=1076125 RepID=A0A6V8LDA3_9ACTN|nr:nitrite reductase small subunit NirD [Phytohabitans rumicis]GFJ94304.1 (2Fe-2S)-binding protein [Phytohabitans rumicis]